ncbi:metal ABC transporter substrate-binding protein [Paenibacillus sp. J2TS4]|uniref:metal ABC transporter substrate-binding protein n=1 Tax=Paenibacillus sp. J2TS4 TaxID=2807194 RepID=UPI001B12BA08|nr:metal ABC transporter substrate-binding protein [Paenibacillus sp. J2TS4]GIP35307.1 ABC transporter substrate-binding protein [Paenibacillus sp. J2TS4]
MRNRKTIYWVLVILTSLAILLGGCGGSQADLVEGKTNVITSFYPLYDFASKIGGDRAHVINLVPAGVEPHDWSPKSKDISQINKADVFVYQGAGFEGWVDEVLGSMKPDSGVIVVEASHGLELLAGEQGHAEEGQSDEHDSDKEEAHGRVEAEEGHHHDHGSIDPHAWLSPPNAKVMAESIKNALLEADPDNKDYYEANYSKLAEDLDRLHQKYKETLSALPKKEIVVSHQAFGYLAHEYGLTQKAIMGLAPDGEPTAQDMKKISQFVRDNGIQYIFFEELVSDSLANTLAEDLKIETLVLNPLEGLTDKQLAAGEDYFSVMENNLNHLVKALK